MKPRKRTSPIPKKGQKEENNKRAEINKNDNKNKELNETKSSFYDKINKINKSIARLRR